MVHNYRPIEYHANIAKGEHSNTQSSAINPVQPSQETEIFIKNFKCNLYDVIPQIVVVVDMYLTTLYKYPRTQSTNEFVPTLLHTLGDRTNSNIIQK